MIIYLKDEIRVNLTNKFLHYISKLKEGEPITIYLNTNGGDIADQELILEVINKYKDNIHLIACGNIYSAGFTIFFKSQCKRSIAKGTTGMAHFVWTEIEVDQSGKPKTDYGKFVLKTMVDSKKEFIEFLKELGLNNKEVSEAKKGEEVYFTESRLKELLNKQLDGKKEE